LAKTATEIVTKTQNTTTERIYFKYLMTKTLYQEQKVLSITREENPVRGVVGLKAFGEECKISQVRVFCY